MIASLMMYARPELEAAYERFWSLIRYELQQVAIESPAELSQELNEFYVWNHPDLLLSETCGMPYRLWLHPHVNLVGALDYGINGCPPGYYCSALVVRYDDERSALREFDQAMFAYNQEYSHSGFNAAYWHVEPHGFWFENQLHTGQHLMSAKAVADGNADIASLDAISWRLISRYEAFASQLRILEWTQPTPGLPLITGLKYDASVLAKAVERSIESLSDYDRTDLGLRGIVNIPKYRYLEISNPPLLARHCE